LDYSDNNIFSITVQHLEMLVLQSAPLKHWIDGQMTNTPGILAGKMLNITDTENINGASLSPILLH